VRNGIGKIFKKSRKQVFAVFVLGPLLLPVSPVGAWAAVKSTQEADAEAAKITTTYDAQIAAKTATSVNIQLAPSSFQVEQAKKARLLAETSKAQVINEASYDEKMDWVKKAAGAYGIDWKLLAAVWQIESGQRWYSNIRSDAGAYGPCQFVAGTWRTYGQDGNGDGTRDAADARDCLFGAAKLLAANGAASGRVSDALLRYNHSMVYVAKVIKLAESY